MAHRVLVPKSVQKQIDKLPTAIGDAITEAIVALENQPRPHGCKKMKGIDAWRIRVGEYRIVYEIRDREVVVIIIDVGHRRDIYR